MDIKNERLKDSLIIMKTLSSELQNANNALMYVWRKQREEYNGNHNSPDLQNIGTALYGLLFFSLIKYCSFVDEYERHFLDSGHSKDEIDAINRIDKRCKEEKYFKVIDEYFKELKITRNTILAHGYRGHKKGGSQRLPANIIYSAFQKISSHGSSLPYEALASIPFRILEAIESEFDEITKDVLSDYYTDSESLSNNF